MKKQLLPLLLVFVLLKTSYASNLVWARAVNETNNGGINVNQLSLSSDTGLLAVIGGYNLDTINVDLQGGFTNAVDPNGGTSQFSLVKYDLTGNLQWYKTWSSVGTDYLNFYGMAQRSGDGHIFLYGTFSSALDADPGPSVVSLTGGLYAPVFVIELDNQGNYVWSGTLNSVAGGFTPTGLAITSTGNIILTATFSSNVNIDFLTNNHVLNIGTADDNSFIACYNPSHQLIWGGAISALGNNYADINALAINPFNNDIYVSGTLYGGANFNVLSGNNTINGISTQDIFIAHYDSAGNYQAALDMGTTGTSAPDKLQFIPTTGEILLNGYTGGSISSSINIDPNGGGYTVSASGTNIHGFLARYGADLSYIWGAAFSSATGNARIFNPQFDPRSGLSVMVQSDTTFNADLGAGTDNIVLSNSEAIVLLDYYSGNYISSIVYPGNYANISRTLAYNGNLYTSGNFYSGFNAALNGNSDMLQNIYGPTGGYGTPYLAEYNFLAATPTVQVSNLHFTSGNDTTVMVAFTPGNGEKRLVLVTEDSAVNYVPGNGYLDFPSDTDFTQATQFPGGVHVVYLDSGQAFTLTGIDTTGGHKYYFTAYEVSGGFVNGVSYPTASFDIRNPPTAVYPVPVIPNAVIETASDKMNLYPNPTKDIINLYTNFVPAPKTLLKVLNITGQVVYEQAAFQIKQQRINTQALSSGIYFVEMENAGEKYTSKFVKE